MVAENEAKAPDDAPEAKPSRMRAFHIGVVLGITWGSCVALMNPDTAQLPGLGPMSPITFFCGRIFVGAAIGIVIDLLIRRVWPNW
jgi:hypothetical protein